MEYKGLAKSMVPLQIRKMVRQWRNQRRFHQMMRQYVLADSCEEVLTTSYCNELVEVWGNQGWSALDEFLLATVRAVVSAEGPILECGSGLSTLLMGEIVKRTGNELWSLEHTPSWAKRVTTEIERWNLKTTHLCLTKLKDYGEFSWYDPPLGDMPDMFSLVICDGPPANTPGGRYGMLPVMRDKLSSSAVILLDDTKRQAERDIVDRWVAELGCNYTMLGVDKPYARIAP